MLQGADVFIVGDDKYMSHGLDTNYFFQFSLSCNFKTNNTVHNNDQTKLQCSSPKEVYFG